MWFILEDWCTVGEIVCGEIDSVDMHNNRAVVKKFNRYGNPRSIRFDLLFPTREALCEHYRKIFE